MRDCADCRSLSWDFRSLSGLYWSVIGSCLSSYVCGFDWLVLVLVTGCVLFDTWSGHFMWCGWGLNSLFGGYFLTCFSLFSLHVRVLGIVDFLFSNAPSDNPCALEG